MSAEDREKWESRYRNESGGRAPGAHITFAAEWLPETGRALDLAGGAGQDAIFLAQRGLEVTLVDIAESGIFLATRNAAYARVSFKTLAMDLDLAPPPPGPWDVVHVSYYLARELLAGAAELLAPRGVLVTCHPTTRNLERHARPSARYLATPGELARLVRGTGLTILHESESWRENDHHEAWIVARREGETAA